MAFLNYNRILFDGAKTGVIYPVIYRLKMEIIINTYLKEIVRITEKKLINVYAT